MSHADQEAPDFSAIALGASGDVAYAWNLDTDKIEFTGSLASFGLTAATAPVSGRSLVQRINPEDVPSRQHRLSRHIHADEVFEAEYRLRADNGSQLWVQDRGRVERDAEGRAARMTGVLRSIGERKDQEARLEQLANFDELTGHFNKARLREALGHVLAYSATAKLQGAYLVVGLDNLAMVNDAFGCEAADGVIVEIGQRLDRCLGLSDVIGRLGGDRFGLVLGSCPPDRVAAAAERILAAISRAPVATAEGAIWMTASIGAVTFPDQASTAQEAMTRAETALAQAKRSGRDCFSPYRLTEVHRQTHRAGMSTGERVQRALKEDRLRFAFQPVVRASDGKVDYYECLIRMVERDGTIIAAGQFVPAIEQLGFIRTLDRYVLEKAVEELGADPEISLGFNISGLTAADKPWLRAIASLLRNRPSVARRIVVEITETAALSDIEESAEFVRTLRDLGCRVALDDFGAGFTSLRHLKTLAVDTVKIDGSFIRDIATNAESQQLLRHMLGLAWGLGLGTVAEFVETEEQAAILRREGVDLLQGYHFGKPMLERPWAPAPRALAAAAS